MEFQDRRLNYRSACGEESLCRGLAQDAIFPIERHRRQDQCDLRPRFERGLDAARAADTARARGETRPLLAFP